MGKIEIVKWFGRNWKAPICKPENKTKIPIKEICFCCGMQFNRSSQGVMLPFVDKDGQKLVPYHLDCFLYSVGIIVKDSRYDIKIK